MNKTNKNQLQQGDTIFNRVNLTSTQLLQAKKIPRNGKIVIAHGESGHSHVIEDDDAELVQLGEKILLKVNSPVEYKHEEHKAFTIGIGIWDFGQVVEKDWLSGMVNSVRD
jgi:hypothetical protein